MGEQEGDGHQGRVKRFYVYGAASQNEMCLNSYHAKKQIPRRLEISLYPNLEAK